MSLSEKVQKEKVFLRFILENPNIKQTRKFLQTLLTDNQYKVLQEIATNCLEERIPYFSHKERAQTYIKKFKSRLKKLRAGKLHDKNLHHLLELLQILVLCTLRHYNKKLIPNISIPQNKKGKEKLNKIKTEAN